MNISKFTLAGLALIMLMACQSTPPPVEDPSNTTVTTGNDNDGSKQSALTASEVKEVEDAIKAAEDADSASFSPELLKTAKDDLEKAKTLGSTGNPVEGRKFLASSLAAAKEALKNSLAVREGQWKSRLTTADDKALGTKANFFMPEEYKNAKDLKTQAEALMGTDFEAGKALAQKSLEAYGAMLSSLEASLGEINRLKDDTSSRLAEAEALEAFIWVPDTLEAANDAYFQGSNAYAKYNLSESKEGYTQARFLAGKAVQDSKNQKAKKETEDLMLETMRKIEKASNLIILDDKDKVVKPEPWDGTPFLKTATPQPQSYLLPTDGTPLVLEEESRVTYLGLAKDLWYKGVEEKNLGNFTVANQYFLESQRYVALYESLAVDKLYTVRLIPERRDALWRIAEYKNIYGDPLQWPLIWKRNRKLIQNPDLILPGWQLIIPPK